MAASSVEIVNSALHLLKEDSIISLDDNRLAARLASTEYDAQRKRLIRSYRWKFATARAVLAPEAAAPLFGFSYQFLLPADCLRFVGVYDGNTLDSQRNYTGADIVHKIEGRYVLCDVNPLRVFYLRDVTNPVEMDAIFVEALAALLAVKLAIPLTNDTDKYKLAKDVYAEALVEARRTSAMEGTPEILMADDWITSRFNGYTTGRESLIGL